MIEFKFVFSLGAASMDPKSNGKVSMLALAYVLVTNLFGVLMALALFFSFSIGKIYYLSNFSIKLQAILTLVCTLNMHRLRTKWERNPSTKECPDNAVHHL